MRLKQRIIVKKTRLKRVVICEYSKTTTNEINTTVLFHFIPTHDIYTKMALRYFSTVEKLREQLALTTEKLAYLNQEYREHEFYEERRIPSPSIRSLLEKINLAIDEKHRITYHLQELTSMPVDDNTPRHIIQSYISKVQEKRTMHYEDWLENYTEYQKAQRKIEETDMQLGRCLREDDEYYRINSEYQILCKERNRYQKCYLYSLMKVRIYQDIYRFMAAKLDV